jgi:hypothetical protein
MWHDSESYAGPIELMVTLLPTSQHKALAYQKIWALIPRESYHWSVLRDHYSVGVTLRHSKY